MTHISTYKNFSYYGLLRKMGPCTLDALGCAAWQPLYMNEPVAVWDSRSQKEMRSFLTEMGSMDSNLIRR